MRVQETSTGFSSKLPVPVNVASPVACACFFLLLILLPVPKISALRCFQCGLYIAPELPYSNSRDLPPGQLIPCQLGNLSLTDIKDCKPYEKHCIKYINKGLQVLACAEKCIDDVNSYSEREIHCCQDDACNHSSPTVTASQTLYLSLLSSVLIAFFLTMLA